MDGESSSERFDDASSIVRNHTTSADDELMSVVGKKVIAKTPLNMTVMILRPEACLQDKMAVYGLPRVPHHQEHVHVILDTPTKTNWCCKNHPK